MKTFIFGDGNGNESKFAELTDTHQYYDLRKGHDEVEVLMDLYESIHPEYIQTVREAILAFEPEQIVVIGRMEGYVWLGTIISRIFGQFNSWNNQRENAFGKTILTIQGKEVPLYTIESLEDWNEYIK